MNTEALKFRVWDNVNKRYVPYRMLIDDEGYICFEDGRRYEHQEDFTIERCTGLLDKNGKLIYEGDVLYIGLPGLELGTVYWSDGRFLAILKQDERTGATITHYFDRQQFEIVGNIHEVKNENS